MAFSLAIACSLAACGYLNPNPDPSLEPVECTAIGCENAVGFSLDIDLVTEVAYDIEACLDDRCEAQTLRVPPPADGPFTGTAVGNLSLDTISDSITMALGLGSFEGVHIARLSVRDEAGELIAEIEANTEFERQQPNGPGCEPICWFARVEG